MTNKLLRLTNLKRGKLYVFVDTLNASWGYTTCMHVWDSDGIVRVCDIQPGGSFMVVEPAQPWQGHRGWFKTMIIAADQIGYVFVSKDGGNIVSFREFTEEDTRQ